jgi:phosphate:Na+ symporter
VELLRENEKAIDSIHEKAGNYLHKISTLMLNEKDRAKKRALVHAVADLERIGDLAENIAEYARQDKIVFSDKAKQDLEVFFAKAVQVFATSAHSLKITRTPLDMDIGRMEHQLDELKKEYKNRYLRRLQEDSSRPVVDALYPNVLKDIERITVHANNIAEHVLKIK